MESEVLGAINETGIRINSNRNEEFWCFSSYRLIGWVEVSAVSSGESQTFPDWLILI